MLEHWRSICGNSNSARLWGLNLPTTDQDTLPNTLFEAHGLEVENCIHRTEKGDVHHTLHTLFTRPVLKNLRKNPHSRLMLQCATEYTRVGEEPYSTVYAWLRAQGVPLTSVIVLCCSKHLITAAKRTWRDIQFCEFDWWEYSPRWWYEGCTPTGKPTQRFTCLNRRPQEWRAALTQYLSQLPGYWQNSLHTIGNRNYHATPTDEPQMQDDYRNHGPGYFEDSIEELAQAWYKRKKAIQLPGVTTFIDPRLYDATRSGALNIVTESYPNQQRHSPTEKTYRVYAAARPHVTLGHHNWCRNLLERGYQTYPWDAQYDHIRDHNQRFWAVAHTLKQFVQMDDKTFKRTMKSVQHTVVHNHENWLRRTDIKRIHSNLPKELQP